MGRIEALSASVEASIDNLVSYSRDNQAVVAVGAGAALVACYYLLTPKLKARKSKPTTAELTAGGIERKNVQVAFDDYSDSYGKEAGEGIIAREKTSELVDTFYNLVTDIYEWGWGQSFHFSPQLPGKDHAASEAAHEARLAAFLQLKPGQKALDVGCGVGGPMRTIASVSGAHVTGITINSYQVARAKHHNEKAGVAVLCNPVQGDFTKMPFQNESFDAAYAIEATCHAAKLEEVYGEVFRVLKPGGMFATYEWVATKHYDPNNPEHVRIMDEINFGNGLPEMRTYLEAEQAGKTVGFEMLHSLDLAEASIVTGPWYGRLKFSRAQHHINHFLVSFFCMLGLAPRGLRDVHKMLVDVAGSLSAGGDTKVFSPMHMIVFRKPDAPKPAAAKPAAAKQ